MARGFRALLPKVSVFLRIWARLRPPVVGPLLSPLLDLGFPRVLCRRAGSMRQVLPGSWDLTFCFQLCLKGVESFLKV